MKAKGVLIKKVNSEPGDGTPNGTFGKIILHADSPESMKEEFPDVSKMYCIVWDNKPQLLVATVDTKVEIIDEVPIEFETTDSVEFFCRQYKTVIPFFNYYE